jgi:hypothetical protein
MFNIDSERVYMELARNKWDVKELCERTEWQPARFYQMMRRGTATAKAVGILADVLGVSPETIVTTKKRFK